MLTTYSSLRRNARCRWHTSQRVAAHHGPHCCGCTPTCRTAAHAARRCVGIPLGASSATLLGTSRACVCTCGTYPRADLWLCLLRWLHFADVVALGATSRPARLRCNQRCVWESMLRRDFPATLPRASCVQVQQVAALNGDGHGIITGAAPAGRHCNSKYTYSTTPRVVRAHQSGGAGAGSGGLVRRLAGSGASVPDGATAQAPQLDRRNPLTWLRGTLAPQQRVVACAPRACSARWHGVLAGASDYVRREYWERQRSRAAYRRYNRLRSSFVLSEQAHLRGGYASTLCRAHRAVGGGGGGGGVQRSPCASRGLPVASYHRTKRALECACWQVPTATVSLSACANVASHSAVGQATHLVRVGLAHQVRRRR